MVEFKAADPDFEINGLKLSSPFSALLIKASLIAVVIKRLSSFSLDKRTSCLVGWTLTSTSKGSTLIRTIATVKAKYVDLNTPREDSRYIITSTWQENVKKQMQLSPFNETASTDLVSVGDETLANNLPYLTFTGQINSYIIAHFIGTFSSWTSALRLVVTTSLFKLNFNWSTKVGLEFVFKLSSS